jgi:hypothetical protein
MKNSNAGLRGIRKPRFSSPHLRGCRNNFLPRSIRLEENAHPPNFLTPFTVQENHHGTPVGSRFISFHAATRQQGTFLT